MCNIAGYVGTREAAPILIEMMKKQEGFAGGYYTGIATIHERKLYSDKLVGDTLMLEEKTDAAKFPGTIGILHSRSKSGGGVEWAHPFLGVKNGEAQMAYVANGASGFFTERKAEYSAIAEGLIAEGYDMDSRVMAGENRYNTLSDGTSVHMSDVMCQLIFKKVNDGESYTEAMENAFCQIPSEIVGLVISLSEPERIFWSRINMPMFVAHAEHGTYMASTPVAFPDDAGEPHLLPPMSRGYVTNGGFCAKHFEKEPAKVAPLSARVMHDAYAVVESLISSGDRSFKELVDAVMPVFDPADCIVRAALVYSILYSIKKQGRLKLYNVSVPGVYEGIEAPEIRIGIL